MTTPARVAAAAVIGVLAIGGAMFILGRSGQSTNVGGPSPSISPATPSPSGSSSALSTPSTTLDPSKLDYATLKGRILMEHAGNAPDLSESSSTDYHIDRRRFYWMDPATMTGATSVQFLAGQPAPGKITGDISPDQTKIVFQDPGDGTGEHIWTANLDGTGLAKVETTCSARAACGDWQPAFDPTGTKVVFVRAQADTTILEIKDLVTGAERKLLSTEGSSMDLVADQPAWSPDGTKIAFGRIHWSGPIPISGTISIVDVASDKTTALAIPRKLPGDPHWSHDGSRILFTDGPLSTASVPFEDRPTTGDIFTIAPDGGDLRPLTQSGGNITAEYTPDGQYILYFSDNFWMMRADGSDHRPLNVHGDDLSTTEGGFGYVGHWIDNP